MLDNYEININTLAIIPFGKKSSKNSKKTTKNGKKSI